MRAAGRLLSSLRVRLIALVLVAVAPAFALILYTGIEERSDRRDQAEEDVLRLTQIAAAQQLLQVQGAEQFLGVLGGLVAQSGVSEIEPESCSRALAALLERNEQYANIGIADRRGDIFCSGLPSATVVNATDRTWFQRAVRTRAFAIGDYQIGRITGKPTVNFGSPIIGPDGGVEAVLFAALDLAWLNDLAASADLPEGGALMVIDRAGTILARYPDPELWVGESVPDAPAVRAVLAGQRGTAQGEWADGTDRVFAFTPLGDEALPQAYVTIGIAAETAFGPAEAALRRNLVLLGIAAAAALVASWFVGERFVLRGVRALVGATERVAAGDLSARTGIAHSGGEVNQLAQRFDEMAASLEERERARRRAEAQLQQTVAELARSNADLEQFAYVASHDLQEPLRMVSSYTQLLARRYQGRLDAEANEFIGFAVDGAGRMQRLIDELLAYSRVSTRGRELVPCSTEAVLQAALANLRASIEESDAEVTHGALPAVQGDEAQLVQLFQNLIGNAVKFRGAEAPRIHVSAERDGDGWRFAVRDNGIGIDPEYADRIFVLFQRLHQRERYEGTGIGLAICKKIVERHGGRIWVESRDGAGATFFFTLRAASASTQDELAEAAA
jgi:signal transduction histidine kinase